LWKQSKTQETNWFCTIQAHILSKKKIERELKYVAGSPLLLSRLLLLSYRYFCWSSADPREINVCFHRLSLHFHDIVCLEKFGPSIFMTGYVQYFYLLHESQIRFLFLTRGVCMNWLSLSTSNVNALRASWWLWECFMFWGCVLGIEILAAPKKFWARVCNLWWVIPNEPCHLIKRRKM
jgi:hypothetical protein